MINLVKIADQQDNQLALKIKIIILKQTHYIKLSGSSAPITRKLQEVNETTKNWEKYLKKNVPQPAIENTPPPQPIEKNAGLIFVTELENTLKNLKNSTGFFKHMKTQNMVECGIIILLK